MKRLIIVIILMMAFANIMFAQQFNVTGAERTNQTAPNDSNQYDSDANATRSQQAPSSSIRSSAFTRFIELFGRGVGDLLTYAKNGVNVPLSPNQAEDGKEGLIEFEQVTYGSGYPGIPLVPIEFRVNNVSGANAKYTLTLPDDNFMIEGLITPNDISILANAVHTYNIRIKPNVYDTDPLESVLKIESWKDVDNPDITFVDEITLKATALPHKFGIFSNEQLDNEQRDMSFQMSLINEDVMERIFYISNITEAGAITFNYVTEITQGTQHGNLANIITLAQGNNAIANNGTLSVTPPSPNPNSYPITVKFTPAQDSTVYEATLRMTFTPTVPNNHPVFVREFKITGVSEDRFVTLSGVEDGKIDFGMAYIDDTAGVNKIFTITSHQVVSDPINISFDFDEQNLNKDDFRITHINNVAFTGNVFTLEPSMSVLNVTVNYLPTTGVQYDVYADDPSGALTTVELTIIVNDTGRANTTPEGPQIFKIDLLGVGLEPPFAVKAPKIEFKYVLSMDDAEYKVVSFDIDDAYADADVIFEIIPDNHFEIRAKAGNTSIPGAKLTGTDDEFDVYFTPPQVATPAVYNATLVIDYVNNVAPAYSISLPLEASIINPPPAPIIVLTAPLYNASEEEDIDVTFTWTIPNHDTTIDMLILQIRIADSPEWSSDYLVRLVELARNATTIDLVLDYGKLYEWRVGARNIAGTTYSAVERFKVMDEQLFFPIVPEIDDPNSPPPITWNDEDPNDVFIEIALPPSELDNSGVYETVTETLIFRPHTRERKLKLEFIVDELYYANFDISTNLDDSGRGETWFEGEWTIQEGFSLATIIKHTPNINDPDDYEAWLYYTFWFDDENEFELLRVKLNTAKITAPKFTVTPASPGVHFDTWVGQDYFITTPQTYTITATEDDITLRITPDFNSAFKVRHGDSPVTDKQPITINDFKIATPQTLNITFEPTTIPALVNGRLPQLKGEFIIEEIVNNEPVSKYFATFTGIVRQLPFTVSNGPNFGIQAAKEGGTATATFTITNTLTHDEDPSPLSVTPFIDVDIVGGLTEVKTGATTTDHIYIYTFTADVPTSHNQQDGRTQFRIESGQTATITVTMNLDYPLATNASLADIAVTRRVTGTNLQYELQTKTAKNDISVTGDIIEEDDEAELRPVTLTAPLANATNVGNRPTFTWTIDGSNNAHVPPTSLRLQVQRQNVDQWIPVTGYDPVQLVTTPEGDSWSSADVYLAYNTTYRWRILSSNAYVDEVTDTTLNPFRTFTTMADPGQLVQTGSIYIPATVTIPSVPVLYTNTQYNIFIVRGLASGYKSRITILDNDDLFVITPQATQDQAWFSIDTNVVINLQFTPTVPGTFTSRFKIETALLDSSGDPRTDYGPYAEQIVTINAVALPTILNFAHSGTQLTIKEESAKIQNQALTLEPAIQFGNVHIGQEKTIALRLTNQTNERVIIDQNIVISNDSPHYSLVVTNRNDIANSTGGYVLGTLGSYADIEITYAPESNAAAHNEKLTFSQLRDMQNDTRILQKFDVHLSGDSHTAPFVVNDEWLFIVETGKDPQNQPIYGDYVFILGYHDPIEHRSKFTITADGNASVTGIRVSTTSAGYTLYESNDALAPPMTASPFTVNGSKDIWVEFFTEEEGLYPLEIIVSRNAEGQDPAYSYIINKEVRSTLPTSAGNIHLVNPRHNPSLGGEKISVTPTYKWAWGYYDFDNETFYPDTHPIIDQVSIFVYREGSTPIEIFRLHKDDDIEVFKKLGFRPEDYGDVTKFLEYTPSRDESLRYDTTYNWHIVTRNNGIEPSTSQISRFTTVSEPALIIYNDQGQVISFPNQEVSPTPLEYGDVMVGFERIEQISIFNPSQDDVYRNVEISIEPAWLNNVFYAVFMDRDVNDGGRTIGDTRIVPGEELYAWITFSPTMAHAHPVNYLDLIDARIIVKAVSDMGGYEIELPINVTGRIMPPLYTINTNYIPGDSFATTNHLQYLHEGNTEGIYEYIISNPQPYVLDNQGQDISVPLTIYIAETGHDALTIKVNGEEPVKNANDLIAITLAPLSSAKITVDIAPDVHSIYRKTFYISDDYETANPRTWRILNTDQTVIVAEANVYMNVLSVNTNELLLGTALAEEGAVLADKTFILTNHYNRTLNIRINGVHADVELWIYSETTSSFVQIPRNQFNNFALPRGNNIIQPRLVYVDEPVVIQNNNISFVYDPAINTQSDPRLIYDRVGISITGYILNQEAPRNLVLLTPVNNAPNVGMNPTFEWANEGLAEYILFDIYDALSASDYIYRTEIDLIPMGTKRWQFDDEHIKWLIDNEIIEYNKQYFWTVWLNWGDPLQNQWLSTHTSSYQGGTGLFSFTLRTDDPAYTPKSPLTYIVEDFPYSSITTPVNMIAGFGGSGSHEVEFEQNATGDVKDTIDPKNTTATIRAHGSENDLRLFSFKANGLTFNYTQPHTFEPEDGFKLEITFIPDAPDKTIEIELEIAYNRDTKNDIIEYILIPVKAVAVQPPAIIVETQPVDTIWTNLNPVFTWVPESPLASTDRIYFRIREIGSERGWVETDSPFMPYVTSTIINANTFLPATPAFVFEYNKEYEWGVYARSADGINSLDVETYVRFKIAPIFDITPSGIDFGRFVIGEDNPEEFTETITIHNYSDAPAGMNVWIDTRPENTPIEIYKDGELLPALVNGQHLIPRGQSITLTAVFNPEARFNGELTLRVRRSENMTDVKEIQIRGEAIFEQRFVPNPATFLRPTMDDLVHRYPVLRWNYQHRVEGEADYFEIKLYEYGIHSYIGEPILVHHSIRTVDLAEYLTAPLKNGVVYNYSVQAHNIVGGSELAWTEFKIKDELESPIFAVEVLPVSKDNMNLFANVGTTDNFVFRVSNEYLESAIHVAVSNDVFEGFNYFVPGTIGIPGATIDPLFDGLTVYRIEKELHIDIHVTFIPEDNIPYSGSIYMIHADITNSWQPGDERHETTVYFAGQGVHPSPITINRTRIDFEFVEEAYDNHEDRRYEEIEITNHTREYITLDLDLLGEDAESFEIESNTLLMLPESKATVVVKLIAPKEGIFEDANLFIAISEATMNATNNIVYKEFTVPMTAIVIEPLEDRLVQNVRYITPENNSLVEPNVEFVFEVRGGRPEEIKIHIYDDNAALLEIWDVNSHINYVKDGIFYTYTYTHHTPFQHTDIRRYRVAAMNRNNNGNLVWSQGYPRFTVVDEPIFFAPDVVPADSELETTNEIVFFVANPLGVPIYKYIIDETGTRVNGGWTDDAYSKDGVFGLLNMVGSSHGDNPHPDRLDKFTFDYKPTLLSENKDHIVHETTLVLYSDYEGLNLSTTKPVFEKRITVLGTSVQEYIYPEPVNVVLDSTYRTIEIQFELEHETDPSKDDYREFLGVEIEVYKEIDGNLVLAQNTANQNLRWTFLTGNGGWESWIKKREKTNLNDPDKYYFAFSNLYTDTEYTVQIIARYTDVIDGNLPGTRNSIPVRKSIKTDEIKPMFTVSDVELNFYPPFTLTSEVNSNPPLRNASDPIGFTVTNIFTEDIVLKLNKQYFETDEYKERATNNLFQFGKMGDDNIITWANDFADATIEAGKDINVFIRFAPLSSDFVGSKPPTMDIYGFAKELLRFEAEYIYTDELNIPYLPEYPATFTFYQRPEAANDLDNVINFDRIEMTGQAVRNVAAPYVSLRAPIRNESDVNIPVIFRWSMSNVIGIPEAFNLLLREGNVLVAESGISIPVLRMYELYEAMTEEQKKYIDPVTNATYDDVMSFEWSPEGFALYDIVWKDEVHTMHSDTAYNWQILTNNRHTGGNTSISSATDYFTTKNETWFHVRRTPQSTVQYTTLPSFGTDTGAVQNYYEVGYWSKPENFFIANARDDHDEIKVTLSVDASEVREFKFEWRNYDPDPEVQNEFHEAVQTVYNGHIIVGIAYPFRIAKGAMIEIRAFYKGLAPSSNQGHAATISVRNYIENMPSTYHPPTRTLDAKGFAKPAVVYKNPDLVVDDQTSQPNNNIDFYTVTLNWTNPKFDKNTDVHRFITNHSPVNNAPRFDYDLTESLLYYEVYYAELNNVTRILNNEEALRTYFEANEHLKIDVIEYDEEADSYEYVTPFWLDKDTDYVFFVSAVYAPHRDFDGFVHQTPAAPNGRGDLIGTPYSPFAAATFNRPGKKIQIFEIMYNDIYGDNVDPYDVEGKIFNGTIKHDTDVTWTWDNTILSERQLNDLDTFEGDPYLYIPVKNNSYQPITVKPIISNPTAFKLAQRVPAYEGETLVYHFVEFDNEQIITLPGFNGNDLKDLSVIRIELNPASQPLQDHYNAFSLHHVAPEGIEVAPIGNEPEGHYWHSEGPIKMEGRAFVEQFDAPHPVTIMRPSHDDYIEILPTITWLNPDFNTTAAIQYYEIYIYRNDNMDQNVANHIAYARIDNDTWGIDEETGELLHNNRVKYTFTNDPEDANSDGDFFRRKDTDFGGEWPSYDGKIKGLEPESKYRVVIWTVNNYGQTASVYRTFNTETHAAFVILDPEEIPYELDFGRFNVYNTPESDRIQPVLLENIAKRNRRQTLPVPVWEEELPEDAERSTTIIPDHVLEAITAPQYRGYWDHEKQEQVNGIARIRLHENQVKAPYYTQETTNPFGTTPFVADTILHSNIIHNFEDGTKVQVYWDVMPWYNENGTIKADTYVGRNQETGEFEEVEIPADMFFLNKIPLRPYLEYRAIYIEETLPNGNWRIWTHQNYLEVIIVNTEDTDVPISVEITSEEIAFGAQDFVVMNKTVVNNEDVYTPVQSFSYKGQLNIPVIDNGYINIPPQGRLAFNVNFDPLGHDRLEVPFGKEPHEVSMYITHVPTEWAPITETLDPSVPAFRRDINLVGEGFQILPEQEVLVMDPITGLVKLQDTFTWKVYDGINQILGFNVYFFDAEGEVYASHYQPKVKTAQGANIVEQAAVVNSFMFEYDSEYTIRVVPTIKYRKDDQLSPIEQEYEAIAIEAEFTTMDVPAPIVLISPVATFEATLSPEFIWEASEDEFIVAYKLYILEEEKEVYSAYINDAETLTYQDVNFMLNYNTDYEWYVTQWLKTYEDGVEIAPTELTNIFTIEEFRTEDIAPIVLVSPIGENAQLNPTFTWEATNNDYVVGYKLYLYLEETLIHEMAFDDVETLEHNPETLLLALDQTYSWYVTQMLKTFEDGVELVDAPTELIDIIAPQRFTTIDDTNMIAGEVYPVGDDIEINPTFTWGLLEDENFFGFVADSYSFVLYLDDEAMEGYPVIVERPSDREDREYTEYDLTHLLTFGQTYQWQITALWSTEPELAPIVSEKFEFTVTENKPIITAENLDTVDTLYPTITWEVDDNNATQFITGFNLEVTIGLPPEEVITVKNIEPDVLEFTFEEPLLFASDYHYRVEAMIPENDPVHTDPTGTFTTLDMPIITAFDIELTDTLFPVITWEADEDEYITGFEIFVEGMEEPFVVEAGVYEYEFEAPLNFATTYEFAVEATFINDETAISEPATFTTLDMPIITAENIGVVNTLFPEIKWEADEDEYIIGFELVVRGMEEPFVVELEAGVYEYEFVAPLSFDTEYTYTVKATFINEETAITEPEGEFKTFALPVPVIELAVHEDDLKENLVIVQSPRLTFVNTNSDLYTDFITEYVLTISKLNATDPEATETFTYTADEKFTHKISAQLELHQRYQWDIQIITIDPNEPVIVSELGYFETIREAEVKYTFEDITSNVLSVSYDYYDLVEGNGVDTQTITIRRLGDLTQAFIINVEIDEDVDNEITYTFGANEDSIEQIYHQIVMPPNAATYVINVTMTHDMDLGQADYTSALKLENISNDGSWPYATTLNSVFDITYEQIVQAEDLAADNLNSLQPVLEFANTNEGNPNLVRYEMALLRGTTVANAVQVVLGVEGESKPVAATFMPDATSFDYDMAEEHEELFLQYGTQYFLRVSAFSKFNAEHELVPEGALLGTPVIVSLGTTLAGVVLDATSIINLSPARNETGVLLKPDFSWELSNPEHEYHIQKYEFTLQRGNTVIVGPIDLYAPLFDELDTILEYSTTYFYHLVPFVRTINEYGVTTGREVVAAEQIIQFTTTGFPESKLVITPTTLNYTPEGWTDYEDVLERLTFIVSGEREFALPIELDIEIKGADAENFIITSIDGDLADFTIEGQTAKGIMRVQGPITVTVGFVPEDELGGIEYEAYIEIGHTPEGDWLYFDEKVIDIEAQVYQIIPEDQMFTVSVTEINFLDAYFNSDNSDENLPLTRTAEIVFTNLKNTPATIVNPFGLYPDVFNVTGVLNLPAMGTTTLTVTFAPKDDMLYEDVLSFIIDYNIEYMPTGYEVEVDVQGRGRPIPIMYKQPGNARVVTSNSNSIVAFTWDTPEIDFYYNDPNSPNRRLILENYSFYIFSITRDEDLDIVTETQVHQEMYGSGLNQATIGHPPHLYNTEYRFVIYANYVPFMNPAQSFVQAGQSLATTYHDNNPDGLYIYVFEPVEVNEHGREIVYTETEHNAIIDFHSILVGEDTVRLVNIKNKNEETDLDIVVTINNYEDVFVVDTYAMTIPAGDSHDIAITFAPQDDINYEAIVSLVVTNMEGYAATIALNAAGISADIKNPYEFAHSEFIWNNETKTFATTLTWNIDEPNPDLALERNGFKIYTGYTEIGETTELEFMIEGLNVNSRYLFDVAAIYGNGIVSQRAEIEMFTGKDMSVPFVVDRDEIFFEELVQLDEAVIQVFEIVNELPREVVAEIRFAEDSEVFMIADSVITLEANDTAVINVTFNPAVVGEHQATLIVETHNYTPELNHDPVYHEIVLNAVVQFVPAPPAAVLLTPENEAKLAELDTVLTWAFDEEEEYLVEAIKLYINDEPVDLEGDVREFALTTEHDAIYEWYIVTYNKVDVETKSETFMFFAPPSIPNPITLLLPEDNAVNVMTNVTLTWEEPITEGIIITDMNLYLWDENDIMVVDAESVLEVTQFEVELDFATTYFWRIDSEGPGGIIPSETRKFTTIVSTPNHVELAFPFDETDFVKRSTMFNWNAEQVGTHTELRFYLSQNVDTIFQTEYISLAADTNSINGAGFRSAALAFNTTYFWAVLPVNDEMLPENAPQVWSFHTEPEFLFETSVDSVLFESDVYVGDTESRTVEITNLYNHDIEIDVLLNDISSAFSIYFTTEIATRNMNKFANSEKQTLDNNVYRTTRRSTQTSITHTVGALSTVYLNISFAPEFADTFNAYINITHNRQVLDGYADLHTQDLEIYATSIPQLDQMFTPVELFATAVNYDVILAWTPPTTVAASLIGYQIWIGEEYLTTVDVTENDFTAENVPVGVHTFSVRSEYVHGVSDFIDTFVVIDNLLPPTNSILSIIHHDVTLTWEEFEIEPVNFLGYAVYKEGILLTNTYELFFTSEDLELGVHNFAIIANYGNGESIPATHSVTIEERLKPENAVGYYYSSSGIAVISWEAPQVIGTTLIGYRIYNYDDVAVELTEENTATINGLTGAVQVFYVTAVYSNGESDKVLVDVYLEDDIIDPVVYKNELKNNYPNPFNPETTIAFTTENAGTVSIEIYNVRGQKVRTLVNDHMDAGEHTATWNGRDDYGRDVATGMYLYIMKTNDYQATKRMTLLK